MSHVLVIKTVNMNYAGQAGKTNRGVKRSFWCQLSPLGDIRAGGFRSGVCFAGKVVERWRKHWGRIILRGRSAGFVNSGLGAEQQNAHKETNILTHPDTHVWENKIIIIKKKAWRQFREADTAVRFWKCNRNNEHLSLHIITVKKNKTLTRLTQQRVLHRGKDCQRRADSWRRRRWRWSGVRTERGTNLSWLLCPQKAGRRRTKKRQEG